MKNRNTFRVIKIYVFLTADFTNKLADSCLNYELQNTVALHNTAEQYPERVLVTNNLNSKIRKEISSLNSETAKTRGCIV